MKRALSVLLVLVLLCGLLPTGVMALETDEPAANDNLLRMWYTKPADVQLRSSRSWMYEALAIGNGYMGGMVFGGIEKDRLHFNEKTMWNGGPTEGGNYIYGNRTDYDQEQTLQDLQTIREKLDDKSEYVFGYEGTNAIYDLNKLMGDLNGFEAFVDYGDIYLDFARSGLTTEQTTNYVRDLDMRTALSTVNYDFDGAHYTREFFSSYPDNVMVTSLTASEAGKITVDISMELSYYGNRQQSNVAQDDTITLTGILSSNGLKNEAQLKVIPTGGEMTANENGSISVTAADAVVLIFACGTDYANVMPTYRGEDPHEAVTARLAAAAAKGYEALKQDHVEDHSALFSRLELNLGEEIPQIPTDELIVRYRNTYNNNGGETLTQAQQRAAEVMSYQFGRYLTIAGSREGALPTNLQGVWGIGSFAWYGDYHFNINVQMNYWPTLASNLSECLLPFNEYVETLRAPGRIAAASAYGIESGEGEENGWLVGCFSTAFGYAAMAQKGNLAGWNPTGSAWALQNIYDYYKFTGDKDYLRDNIYPSMKEVAKFWQKALWWSDYQQRYVSGPSYSPENGPIVNGASYDQQFVWQHFENTIEAAQILGVDEDLVAEWKDIQSKLDPVLIGDSGQVKEWYEETSFGKAQAGDLPETDIPAWRDSLGAGSVPHRHISQLVALYPGTLINKDNKEYMEAAMVTLNERGLDATGWSKAHKLNLWARTGHSEEAFELVRSAVGGNNAGMLTNLFSSHGGGNNYQDYPIFQIDGNFGLTAGINEMLLQSQLGYVDFLPTLPAQWNNGSVEGIVARGNFEIDMQWSDGKADTFVIKARNGGTFVGEYENLAGYTVHDAQGEKVAVQVLGKDKISFETKIGETYTIDFHADDPLTVQKTVAALLAESMTDPMLETAKTVLNKAAAEATDAETLANANGTASRAIEFIDDIADAEEFYEENLHLEEEGAQVANALKELKATIDAAKALLQNAAATKQAFDDKALELEAAKKNVTELNESFQVFVAEITKMEDFRDAQQAIPEGWTAGMAAWKELTDSIDEANRIKTSPTASSADVAASMTRMENAKLALLALFENLAVEIQYVDGVLTLIPSDESFEIRYTLDGNLPSEISRVYTEPLTLNKVKLTVYAQLFLDGKFYGEPAVLAQGGDNVALNKPVSSIYYSWSGYDPAKAVDGDRETRWAPYSRYAQMTIDLGEVYEINGGAVYESAYPGRVECYELQVSTESADGPWTTVVRATEMGVSNWKPVKARYVQYVTVEANNSPNIGEIEIYRVSTETAEKADFTKLNEILKAAETVKNGIYQNVEEVAKTEFDKWYDIAAAVAANEGSDQYTVDAAEAALRKAIDQLAVTVSVKGDTLVTVDDETTAFTVAVSNTSNLATVTLEMTLSGNVADPVVETLQGWYIIAQSFENSKLTVVMANNAGLTGQDVADILTVTVKTNGNRGKVSLRVDSATLSAFVGENSETFVDAILTGAFAETEITYSIYDVNHDGIVDQLDITRAQRFYGMQETEADWYAPADVNGDHMVDINDLILIMNNYTK